MDNETLWILVLRFLPPEDLGQVIEFVGGEVVWKVVSNPKYLARCFGDALIDLLKVDFDPKYDYLRCKIVDVLENRKEAIENTPYCIYEQLYFGLQNRHVEDSEYLAKLDVLRREQATFITKTTCCATGFLVTEATFQSKNVAVYVGEKGIVSVVDVVTGQIVKAWDAGLGFISAMDFKDNILVTGGGSKAVKLWDLGKEACDLVRSINIGNDANIQHHGGDSDDDEEDDSYCEFVKLVEMANETFLLTRSRGEINLWNVSSGALVRTICKHISSVAVFTKGDVPVLAIVPRMRVIHILMVNIQTSQLLKTLQRERFQGSGILKVASLLSQNNETLLISCLGGNVTIWNTESWDVVQTVHLPFYYIHRLSTHIVPRIGEILSFLTYGSRHIYSFRENRIVVSFDFKRFPTVQNHDNSVTDCLMTAAIFDNVVLIGGGMRKELESNDGFISFVEININTLM